MEGTGSAQHGRFCRSVLLSAAVFNSKSVSPAVEKSGYLRSKTRSSVVSSAKRQLLSYVSMAVTVSTNTYIQFGLAACEMKTAGSML